MEYPVLLVQQVHPDQEASLDQEENPGHLDHQDQQGQQVQLEDGVNQVQLDLLVPQVLEVCPEVMDSLESQVPLDPRETVVNQAHQAHQDKEGSLEPQDLRGR